MPDDHTGMFEQESLDQEVGEKVALITGGGRRIGAEIARRLHREGMQLILHYRSSDNEAHELQSELHDARPDSVILIKGDLLHNEKIIKLVQEATEIHGRLDVVINNASQFFPTPVGSTTEDDWNILMDANLKAPFFLCQAAATQLRKTRGSIVNIVDIYGERPLKNHAVYSTSKAGLIMLTRALARELAPEVRVNAVAPGAILWPENDQDEVAQQRIVSRTPLKRTGVAADIANAVLFLVRSAEFITGHVIPVDGGRSVVP